MRGRRKTGKGNGTTAGRDESIDELFRLPLHEFTAARNALASRLNQAGYARKASEVKSLAKPSVSAWAVNQLYWSHREDFEKLLAAGRRLVEAQLLQLSGKDSDLNEPQSAQRTAVQSLSQAADALLRESAHNPTPDTMRRINTTLEALSTYSSVSKMPSPGRLTADVHPPAFESLASLIPTTSRTKPTAKIIPFARIPKEPPRQDISDQPNESARMELKNAEIRLWQSQKKVREMEAARKKADADLRKAQREKIEAEERYDKARRTEEDARRRAHSARSESEKAVRELQEAERFLQKARDEI